MNSFVYAAAHSKHFGQVEEKSGSISQRCNKCLTRQKVLAPVFALLLFSPSGLRNAHGFTVTKARTHAAGCYYATFKQLDIGR